MTLCKYLPTVGRPVATSALRWTRDLNSHGRKHRGCGRLWIGDCVFLRMRFLNQNPRMGAD